MANLIPISIFCLVLILHSLPPTGALFRPFWRRTTARPKPTTPLLPPIDKDPEFYRKLRENIPPVKETAKKVVKNLFRIRPAGKRQLPPDQEDAVIVMDGSGSVGSCEFGNGKKAIKNLMSYQQPGVDARYAMVTFSDAVRSDFGFLKQSEAVKRIIGVGFPNGFTNTQAGLAAALNLFKTGGRGFGTRHVVILLTDGQSNVDKEKTIPMAKELKKKGVEVFVVAIGNRHMHGIDEMAQIATYPPADFLFRVAKLADFFRVVALAIKEIAPNQYKILDKHVSNC